MTTFVQCHILTAFAPSNANRDDLGRHKTATIGGTERLRHSSQSRKRAIRQSPFFFENLKGNIGIRTRQTYDMIVKFLMQNDISEDAAFSVAETVAGIFSKLESPRNGRKTNKTERRNAVMVYVSPEEAKKACELALAIANGDDTCNALEKDLKSNVLQKADGAVDIAMFGRMMAAEPDFNRDAAVQVSHAFTTHACSSEEDWFSAVDDLNEHEEAGHIGENSFGSGLFYQYVCINMDLLVKNLSGDKTLAGRAIEALIKALGETTPNGKQNSFATHPRASYMMVEKGNFAPRELSDAFFKAIPKDNILEDSIAALEKTRREIDYSFETEIPDQNVVVLKRGSQVRMSDLVALAVSALDEV